MTLLFAPCAHPGEHGTQRLVGVGACGGRPTAQRGDLGAVVFLPESVLQAVLAVAVGASDARVLHRVDESFAVEMCALVRVVDRGFLRRETGVGACVLGVSSASPFTGFGAFMRGFGAVVQTERPATGLAAEWKEIKLVAVLELTVSPDGF